MVFWNGGSYYSAENLPATIETLKTLEQDVKFNSNNINLVYLLLTFNRFYTFIWCYHL